MKVKVGDRKPWPFGTIEVTPDGKLLVGGPDARMARRFIDAALGNQALADVRGGAKTVLRYMLRSMNNGYMWTVPDDDEAREANRRGTTFS